MNGSTILPPIADLKQQAKRLRAGLGEDGDFISHSESLELVAKQYGMRDWNTLYAATGNRPPPAVSVGAQVKGRYLGQAFNGEVLGVQILTPGRARITIELDDPVDVVTFDSFSAFRRRITATVNADGKSTEKTSNGVPQMVLETVR